MGLLGGLRTGGVSQDEPGQDCANLAAGMGPVRRLTGVRLPQALQLVISPSPSHAVKVFEDTALASSVTMPNNLKEATQAQALAAPLRALRQTPRAAPPPAHLVRVRTPPMPSRSPDTTQ